MVHYGRLTILLIVVFSFLLYAVAPENVLISNVSVPQSSIILDSTKGDTTYYTGITRYDLESAADSILVHIYMEEVPFVRYRIGDTLTVGHTGFVLIDHRSTGDVGWVQPKRNCIIRWSYPTANKRNHCRIKVGIANLIYANTKTTIRDGNSNLLTETQYGYNRAGLLKNASWGTGLGVKTPVYTPNGQILRDDTINVLFINGYDSQFRCNYSERTIPPGSSIPGYVYGYSYDSLSRMNNRFTLQYGSTPISWLFEQNKRDSVWYDSYGRVAFQDRFLSMHGGYSLFCFNSPKCQDFNFAGKVEQRYYYQNMLDSIVVLYKDTLTMAMRAMTVERHFTNTAGRPDSTIATTRMYDEPGTCWGTDRYYENVIKFDYDTSGYAFRRLSLQRSGNNLSFDTILESCYPHIYDAKGNVIESYIGCNEKQVLDWSATYNTFNHILTKHQVSGTGAIIISSFDWQSLNLDTLSQVLTR